MVLEIIKKKLEAEKFECAINPANSEFPLDRLIVFLALDMKERERMLEIFGGQQQFSPELMLPEAATLPYRLHFRVKLPFKVQDTAQNQVASLLLFLNQLIDLPGFELNELEGQVTYRYVWITEQTLITQNLIMSIVGAIMLNLGLFAETIESIADGKVTFNDLLSQIVKMSETAKVNRS